MATVNEPVAAAPSAANESRSLVIYGSNPTDQGSENRGSPSPTRGFTGPRTQQGKAQSKHNALRHGIFSKVAVLNGESQAEFNVLLKGLREDLKPEGALEKLLVDKLTVLFWRFRRLLAAEGAEIQVGTEFAHWDKQESDRQQAATLPQVTCNGGLIRWIANPKALQGCLDQLHDLERAMKANGFYPTYDRSILAKLYGREDHERDSWQTTLVRHYVDWYDTSLSSEEERKEGGYASPDECKENFLEELEKEIQRLERYRKEQTAISARRLAVETHRLPETDRLHRYETAISREIERTLNQLERRQRMRLGQPVPPPINLSVTSSNE